MRYLRKQDETAQSLRKFQEQYQRLIEHASDGIFIADAEGKYIEVNPGGCAMLGYTREEILTKRITDLIAPEDLVATPLRLDEMRQEKTILSERQLIRKDGSLLPVEISARRLPDGQFQAIVRDITERKRAEERLSKSEERYRRLFEHMIEGYAYCQMLFENGQAQDWIYLAVNDAFETLTGLKGAVGKRVSEIIPGIRDSDPELFTIYARVSLTGKPEKFETFVEALHMWFSVSVYSPEKGFFVAVFDVITERKLAEQAMQEYSNRLEADVTDRTRELREAQEQLVRQERLAVLGQLAGSVGHELRNPLGVISNAIYFLKLIQPEANAQVKEYLDILENETRASDKIVTDLLDFTRIKAAEREPVSVADLLGQTLAHYPAPPGVKVWLDIPETVPPIYADPRQIIQVFGNLISNAYQSMPNGGQMTLFTRIQNDMMEVSVQDTGTGIPPENMQKLFEPLFTTRSRGIGLGLAVSKKLTEANGGRIEVQSEREKGSTFTVVLPVYKEVK